MNIESMSPPESVTEADLRKALAREGFPIERWSNGPHAVYAAHEHPYGKILLVVRGSITFTLNESDQRVMQAGDRLEVSAHTRHSAVVGSGGVVCLEAHIL